MSTASLFSRHPYYFDLTELKVGSTGKRGFYGIARVVAELAEALGASSSDLNRELGGEIDSPSDPLPQSSGFLIHRRWHNTFQQVTLETISSADLDNIKISRQPSLSRHMTLGPGFLVSASRPRLLARYGAALARQQLQLVPLIHDLFPLVDKHDQPSPRFLKNFLDHNRMILAQAPLIIANSQCTADSLRSCHRQGLLPRLPPIRVLPLAHELRASSHSGVSATTQGTVPIVHPGESYVLLVGPRLGRRNLQVVLAALALLRSSDQPSPLLILAGAKRKSTSRALASEKWHGIRDMVRVVPTPDQNELRQLYIGAQAVIMPSFLEGWGLPAAESLWMGTPVLAADIPVMHEVCGPLARYFPPDQPLRLAELLAELVTDTGGHAAWAASVVAARHQLRTWQQVGLELKRLMGPLIERPVT